MLKRVLTVAGLLAIPAALAIAGLNGSMSNVPVSSANMLAAATVFAANGWTYQLSSPVVVSSAPSVKISSGYVSLVGMGGPGQNSAGQGSTGKGSAETEGQGGADPSHGDVFGRIARGELPVTLTDAVIEVDLTGASDSDDAESLHHGDPIGDPMGHPKGNLTGSQTGSQTGDRHAHRPVAPLVAALTAAGLSKVSLASSRLIVKTGTGPRLILENAEIEVAKASGSITVTGVAQYLGESVSFNLTLGAVGAERDGAHPIPLKATLSNTLFSTSFNGAVVTGAKARIASKDADLRVPDVAKFLTWIGTEWPARNGIKSFDVDGQFEWTGRAITFPHAKFVIDGNVASGSLSVNDRDRQTFIDGTLAFERLDTTAYLVQPGPALDQSDPIGVVTATDDATPATDLMHGATVPVLEWIDALTTSAIERLSVGPLQRVNADLRLSAARFKARDFNATNIAATLNLNGGHLLADVAEMQLENGGHGTVQIAIDTQGEMPNSRLLAKLEGMSLAVATKMVAGHPLIEGVGNLRASLKGQGLTREALLSSLSGRIDVAATGRVGIAVDIEALVGKGVTQEGATQGGATQTGGTGPQAAANGEAQDAGIARDWERVLSGHSEVNGFSATVRFGDGKVLVEALQGAMGKKTIAGRGHANLPAEQIDLVLDVGQPETPDAGAANAQSQDFGAAVALPAQAGDGPPVTPGAPVEGERVRIHGQWHDPAVAVERIPPKKGASFIAPRYRHGGQHGGEYGGDDWDQRFTALARSQVGG